MRIHWLPAAEHGLAVQLDYIAERHPSAAIAQGDAVLAAVARLVDHPRIGRPGRVPETRELVVVGTPFIVAYTVHGSVVIILRVLHGAQRWPDKF